MYGYMGLGFYTVDMQGGEVMSTKNVYPRTAIEGLVLWEYRGMPMVQAVSWVFLGGGGADSVPETP
jgi:hypothetical protein